MKIRFRKLNHNILIPKPKIPEEDEAEDESLDLNVAKMRYFRKFIVPIHSFVSYNRFSLFFREYIRSQRSADLWRSTLHGSFNRKR